jgi:hypothetical protein
MTTKDQSIIESTKSIEDYLSLIAEDINTLRLQCNYSKTAMHVSDAKKHLLQAIAAIVAARETQCNHIVNSAERGISRID